MSDLTLYRRSSGDYDIAFDEVNGDLLTSDSLENAVVISIGTYARERKLGKVANLKPNVGGWWGDALDEKGTLGGYLYEAFPGKLTDDTARRVEKLCDEALEWILDDGIAQSIYHSVEIIDNETMSLTIGITRPDGSQDGPYMYELKWKATYGI